VQTQTTVRSLLTAAGLRPNKRLGQHFLVDGNLMRKLVASAEIRHDDVVLEVGCGTGSLTQELAGLAAAVVAVEADPGLADIAARELTELANVRLLQLDALRSKTRIEPRVLDAVAEARQRSGGRVLLVANLPYQIASPLVADLLVGPVVPGRMCFTVQKEVGDRLLARSGGDYGPLSVIVQATSDLERIAAVPPQAFWPRPAVESVMIRLDPRPERRQAVGDVVHFAGVVKTCFLHRRKTLAHILAAAYGPDAATDALGGLDVEARTRPEQLSPEVWVELARRLAG